MGRIYKVSLVAAIQSIPLKEESCYHWVPFPTGHISYAKIFFCSVFYENIVRFRACVTANQVL